MRPGSDRDRATSLVVNVVDLRRHMGEQRELHRVARLDELTLGDTTVDAGEPIDVELVLESIPAGIAANGVIAAPWHGTCRRCLDPVSGVLDIAVEEVFAVEQTDGETYPLGHETIDLEPMVRDAVLLSLPSAPLCRDDCAGPDPEAFPVEIEGEGDEPAPIPDAERPKDPRWAALDVLRSDFADEELSGGSLGDESDR